MKEREKFIQVKTVTIHLFLQQLYNEFFLSFSFQKKNREEKKGLNNQRLRSLAHATKPSTKKKESVFYKRERRQKKTR